MIFIYIPIIIVGLFLIISSGLPPLLTLFLMIAWYAGITGIYNKIDKING